MREYDCMCVGCSRDRELNESKVVKRNGGGKMSQT